MLYNWNPYPRTSLPFILCPYNSAEYLDIVFGVSVSVEREGAMFSSFTSRLSPPRADLDLDNDLEKGNQNNVWVTYAQG